MQYLTSKVLFSLPLFTGKLQIPLLRSNPAKEIHGAGPACWLQSCTDG